MHVESDQLLALLKSVSLFSHLNDNQLFELSRNLTNVLLGKDEILYEEGDEADSFYLIIDGRVSITQSRGGINKGIASLSTGDYFGEESFFSHQPRSNSVKAASDCILIRLDYKRFSALFQKVPALRKNLKAAIENRRLAWRNDWNWLAPNEVIYILTRQHPFFFIINIVLPAITFLMGVGIFVFFGLIHATKAFPMGVLIISIVICLGSFFRGVWSVLDWRNSYFFITNKRIICLKVIIGNFERRLEVPLNNLQSVDVTRPFLGQLIDYGNVVIRTFTGKVILNRVKHPYQIAYGIEENWRKARFSTQKESSTLIEKTLREKINPEKSQGQQTGEEQEEATFLKPQTSGFKRFIHLFRIRYEEGDVITYRKHWILLITRTWKQMLIFLLLIGLVIVLFSNKLSLLPFLIVAVFLCIDCGFWLYKFIDWQNDIYQISFDQIIDIERRPLQNESRKAASLDKILTVEYERQNPAEIFFGYGSVRINIGFDTFLFDHVTRPERVQQEIIGRKNRLEETIRQEQFEHEEDRFSTWLTTYHQTLAGQTSNDEVITEGENVQEEIDIEDDTQEDEGEDSIWIG